MEAKCDFDGMDISRIKECRRFDSLQSNLFLVVCAGGVT